MTTFTVRVAGSPPDWEGITREEVISKLGIDPHEFDWAIEEDGICCGVDADGRAVQAVATGDEDRLS
jgi:hypothetical protein